MYLFTKGQLFCTAINPFVRTQKRLILSHAFLTRRKVVGPKTISGAYKRRLQNLLHKHQPVDAEVPPAILGWLRAAGRINDVTIVWHIYIYIYIKSRQQ